MVQKVQNRPRRHLMIRGFNFLRGTGRASSCIARAARHGDSLKVNTLFLCIHLEVVAIHKTQPTLPAIPFAKKHIEIGLPPKQGLLKLGLQWLEVGLLWLLMDVTKSFYICVTVSTKEMMQWWWSERWNIESCKKPSVLKKYESITKSAHRTQHKANIIRQPESKQKAAIVRSTHYNEGHRIADQTYTKKHPYRSGINRQFLRWPQIPASHCYTRDHACWATAEQDVAKCTA